MLPISLLGFTLVAPGAVMIRGRVTRAQNGIISLAGPGTNFLIAAVAWPFTRVVDVSQPGAASQKEPGH